MNYLQESILRKLCEGPATLPQIWGEGASEAQKQKTLDATHELVKRDLIDRIDNGGAWFHYAITNKGRKAMQ